MSTQPVLYVKRYICSEVGRHINTRAARRWRRRRSQRRSGRRWRRFVACGNFTVNNGATISVTVGAGGLTSSSLPSTCPSFAGFLSFVLLYCQLNLDNFCYFCTAVSLQEALHRSAQICRRPEETSALLVAYYSTCYGGGNGGSGGGAVISCAVCLINLYCL